VKTITRLTRLNYYLRQAAKTFEGHNNPALRKRTVDGHESTTVPFHGYSKLLLFQVIICDLQENLPQAGIPEASRGF
jgi:hypothetical protein